MTFINFVVSLSSLEHSNVKNVRERTESGQSTDELYASKWIHYDKLNFLVPAFGASKSRDTLKRMNLQEGESAEKEVTPSKGKTIAEKKLDLLSKGTEAITANAKPKANESSNPKISAFALYVMKSCRS